MDSSVPIKQQIKELMVKQLNLSKRPEEILDDMPLGLNGLDLDSIDYLELVIGVEKQFGIKITDEDLKEAEKIFRSINTLSSFIEKRLAK